MKRWLMVFLTLFLMFINVSAENEEIYRAADGTDVKISGFSFEELARSLAQGEGVPVRTYGERITDFLFGEVKTAVASLGVVLSVALLSGIIGGACFGKSSAEVSFFLCFAIIVGTAVTGFQAIAEMSRSAVESMTVFMSAAVPAMGALGLASGDMSVITSSAPVMTLGALSGQLINYCVIPGVYMSLAMSLVSNMSSGRYLANFSKLIMKTLLWIVCGVQTLFCAAVGISGIASGTLSGMAGKAAKFTMSSSIPVVGSILSDAADALAGSALVIKNTAGAAGMVLLIMLFLAPVLKTAATLFACRLCSAVIQPVCDKRITAVFSDIADVLSVMCGILIACCAGSVISLGLLIGGIK